jgi:hypothetical protein
MTNYVLIYVIQFNNWPIRSTAYHIRQKSDNVIHLDYHLILDYCDPILRT